VSKTAAVVLAFLCLMLFPTASRAQLLPSGNVYVGVAYADSVDVVNRLTFRGLTASAEDLPFKRRPYLGVVLDMSAFFRKGVAGSGTIQEYNALLGPRISKNYGKWRPFAQVMGGIQRSESGGMTHNIGAADLGAGVDRKFQFLFMKSFSWRLQFDYTRTHIFSATQNDFRGSAGLVWRF
jgi:hypothetical protein